MAEKHPKKEIREAIDYAQKHDWTIEKSNSHAHIWGKMLCKYNDSSCRCGKHCITSISSTPPNPSNHARKLKRIVRNCTHFDS